MRQRRIGIYEKRSTEDLRTLLSKKKVSLQKLERTSGFWQQKEEDTLRSQIQKIEVELTARFYQQELPL